MIGLALAMLSTGFEELSDMLGKSRIARRELTVYGLGFLMNLGALLSVLAFGLLIPKDFFAPGFPGGFVFSIASLPTLAIRIVLELLQVYVTVHAIATADRGTFGFLRTLTLPLLLLVDIVIGYGVTTVQMLGIAVIAGSLFLLYINHGLRWQGSSYVLISAVNAVATISLFKYNITHFNSIEAEQTIAACACLIFLFVLALRARQNPLPLLTQPLSIGLVVLSGSAATLMSFAYLFAPASVITAGKRSFAVLWALLSGEMYFKEKHFLLKFLCFCLTCAGITMLAF